MFVAPFYWPHLLNEHFVTIPSRHGGPPCQTIIYEVPNSGGKLTASSCLPVSDTYIKNGFKKEVLEQTDGLELYNIVQIGLMVAIMVIQAYEAVTARMRHQTLMMARAAAASPAPRRLRRNSDFALESAA